jgi:hypothetical protein
LLTFPLILRFPTHLFADKGGDGLQNVWDLWWVLRSAGQAQSPWYTGMLHFPSGVPLRGHSLTPFNGYVAFVLVAFMPLEQAHNFVFVAAFVLGGLTCFWLAFRLSGSYVASVAGGYVFTFSSFHFAHAQGHLNLISVQWVPLFALLWYRLVVQPRVLIAVVAALIHYLILLCEYNFYFSTALAACYMAVWNGFRLRSWAYWIRREYLVSLTIFGVVSVSTSGVLIAKLLWLNHRDPLVGSHDAALAGMDLLAPLVPGGQSMFRSLTEAYWSRLGDDQPVEGSVYLGWSVVLLLLYAWWNRKNLRIEWPGLWFGMLVVFGVLSLGPQLRVAGNPVAHAGFLPYAWAERLFPPFRVASMPVRLMLVPTLCAAVLVTAALEHLAGAGRRGRLLAVALMTVCVVETLPRSLPSAAIAVPPYIRVLERLPAGAVLDAATVPTEGLANMSDDDALWTVYEATRAMYFQIVHQKPIAFGYVARVPASVYEQDIGLVRLLKARRLGPLWPVYRIRYAVLRDGKCRDDFVRFEAVYRDGEVSVYDLDGTD